MKVRNVIICIDELGNDCFVGDNTAGFSAAGSQK